MPIERPREVDAAFWLWVGGMVVATIALVILAGRLSGAMSEAMATSGDAVDPGIAQFMTTFIVVIMIVAAVIGIALNTFFALMMRRGRNWARIVLTIFGGLDVLSAIYNAATGSSTFVNGHLVPVGGPVHAVLSVIQALAVVAAMILFYRPRANAFFAPQPYVPTMPVR